MSFHILCVFQKIRSFQIFSSSKLSNTGLTDLTQLQRTYPLRIQAYFVDSKQTHPLINDMINIEKQSDQRYFFQRTEFLCERRLLKFAISRPMAYTVCAYRLESCMLRLDPSSWAGRVGGFRKYSMVLFLNTKNSKLCIKRILKDIIFFYARHIYLHKKYPPPIRSIYIYIIFHSVTVQIYKLITCERS